MIERQKEQKLWNRAWWLVLKDWHPNTQRSRRRRGKRRLAPQPGLAGVFYLVSCPATGTAAQHFPNQIRVRPDAPDASTENAPVPLWNFSRSRRLKEIMQNKTQKTFDMHKIK